jgi:hypothetical protein
MYKYRIFLIIQMLLLSLIFLMPEISAADNTFRCGSKLVSTGDSKYQVLAKCGKPSYTEKRREKKIKRDLYQDLFPPLGYQGRREQEKYREPLFVEEYVNVEEWTYNRGPNSLLTILTFENGKLVDVETDGYGY